MVVIAYFISSHGFGHASRAVSTMLAVQDMYPNTSFHVYTEVPYWFFERDLQEDFVYHSLKTDIGLVQQNAMSEDADATVNALNQWLPFDPIELKQVGQQLIQDQCQLVISDISPYGLAVADTVGLPTVLTENFTWDWIYQSYIHLNPNFEGFANYFEQIFQTATYRIQIEPVCNVQKRDVCVNPVSRPFRIAPSEMRRKLSVEDGDPLIMVTMGGISEQYGFLQQLKSIRNVIFLLPGISPEEKRDDNLIFIPSDASYHHPDLINTSDCVIGKIGYSTLSEIYHAGVPYGYIPRQLFRESVPLTEFVDRHMPSMRIEEEVFRSGEWLKKVPELLQLQRIRRREENGADQLAEWIMTKVVKK